MANSSDPARRRRSASDVVGLMRAATAPLRQSLAVSLSALGDNAQAAFVRLFDSGYDPSASEETQLAAERKGSRFAIFPFAMAKDTRLRA